MSKIGKIGKQINQRSTKLVRIDAGIHKYLKVAAAKQGITIRDLLEGLLAEWLSRPEVTND